MKEKICVFLFVLLCNFQLQIKAQIDTEQEILMGRNALYNEDYALALKSFDQVISAKSYLPEPYYYRAIAKYFMNDIKGAEEDCSACLKRSPFITNVYQLRGKIRQQLGNYKGAEEDYARALKEMPRDRFLMINLGIINIRQKNYNEAKSYLNQLIKAYPKYNDGYKAMADLCLEMKDTAQAFAYYNNAIEVNKFSSQAYSMRGMLYLQTKKYDEANKDLDEAIKLNSSIASNYINRGLVRYYKNDFRGAMDDYDKALEIEPDNLSAQFNRALLRAQVGDNNRAIEDFDAILKQDPKNYAAYYHRAMLKNATADFHGAINDLNIVMAEYPEYSQGFILRAGIKKQMGDSKGSEKDYLNFHNIELMNQRKQTVRQRRKADPNLDKSINFNMLLVADADAEKKKYADEIKSRQENSEMESRSELKNNLWKTIRPSAKSIYIPNSSQIPTAQQTEDNHGVAHHYEMVKAGISIDKAAVFDKFDKDYKRAHPESQAYNYNCENVIRVTIPSLQIQMMGGSLGTTITGANLSGGGKKHISKKTKKILKEVFGRDVDEEENK